MWIVIQSCPHISAHCFPLCRRHLLGTMHSKQTAALEHISVVHRWVSRRHLQQYGVHHPAVRQHICSHNIGVSAVDFAVSQPWARYQTQLLSSPWHQQWEKADYWTTRGYANSRTGQLTDCTSRILDSTRTRQLADAAGNRKQYHDLLNNFFIIINHQLYMH